MDDDKTEPNVSQLVEQPLQEIFGEYETRTNFVGFFDLLYKIDRRLEPERYEDGADLP